MPQEKKDELIYSLPRLINDILEKDGPLYMILDCLNSIKGQFYEGYATDLLNLIKGHTENVKKHIPTFFQSYHHHFFHQYGKEMITRGLNHFETFLQAYAIEIQTNFVGKEDYITEIWKKFLTNISKPKTTDAKYVIFAL